MTYTTKLGFAASQVLPPDAVAIVEVTVAEPASAIELHERFVDLLTEWAANDSDAQQLIADLDEPVTVGAVLAALDSLTSTSLDHWLASAGMTGARVTTSRAVFDYDALLAE